ncbi:MAG TPA: glycosyltransferase [Pirellulales bacterium]|jgi:hypothetical protein
MRVLIASDIPIEEQGPGARSLSLAVGLDGAGHAVRMIDVGPAGVVSRRIGMRRVIAAPDNPRAELTFDAPHFGVRPTLGRRFTELSDDELSTFRSTLRRALDAEIDDFDPQIVHCQQVWIMAHLALESGAPYVVTALREELAEFEFDSRYQRLAAEAAENASRVIVADAALAAEVQSRFGDLEGRVAIVPGLPEDPAQSLDEACVAELTGLYATVLDERLGRRWRA